jgi:IS30 family transposase
MALAKWCYLSPFFPLTEPNMKKYHQLLAQDRQRIAVLHLNGYSANEIASDLDRNVSTIRREIRRNASPSGYDDKKAHKMAQNRRRESREPYKMKSELVSFVSEKLLIKWSPEQITGRWKLQTDQKVHPNTIYRFLYDDADKGGLLWKNMRSPRKRPKRRPPKKTLRTLIKDRKSIHDRPVDVEQKLRIGDLEMDTIVGIQNRGAIVSITDRVSYHLKLIQIDNREAYNLAERVKKFLKAEKGRIFTITSDNGTEFSEHKRIAKSLNIEYYFADPYQTNQRALIEHENKLIRQYLPKGTDLRFVSQRQLNQIAATLNNRPRKNLGYKTPNEIHFQNLN